MHHLEGGHHSQHGTPLFGSVTQPEEVEMMKSLGGGEAVATPSSCVKEGAVGTSLAQVLLRC